MIKFSKGTVELIDDLIVISFYYRRNKSSRIEIAKKDYNEYSYFKERSKIKLRNWLVVLIHVGLIFLYGYVRSVLEEYQFDNDILAMLDIIFIPLLTLLVIMLMIEILGEFMLLRRFYSFLLTRRKSYLRIVLKSGKSYKIPVRNENEAIGIARIFEEKSQENRE